MSTGAFELGWELAGERRARKQQLSDEERQLKVSNLYDQGHKLAATIPQLSGDERERAMQQLVDVEQNIADIYHPQKNPGALRKDWDLLKSLILRKPRSVPLNFDPTRTTTQTPDFTLPGTDITLPGSTYDVRPAPQAMTPQQRQEMQNRDQARRAAELDVAAAGLSPEQQAAINAREKLAEQDAMLDWAKKHGVSGEALQELTQTLAGLPKRAKLAPLGKPYKGPDGKYYQPVRDPDTGLIADEPMPANYTPPASTAAPTRAWKKDASGRIVSFLLDRTTGQPVPNSERSDLLPPAYLTGKMTTGFHYWQDDDGNIHATPETRTTAPVLPGGAPRSTTDGTGAPSSARSRRAPSSAAPSSGVKGDRILGHGRTPELSKARASLADATKIARLADTLVADADKAHQDGRNVAEQDALFVLALIRSEAGRVNQKEIEQIFQAGGIEEGPERWAARIGHGELSDDLRSQLQRFTHQQVDAAQAAVNSLTGGQASFTPGAGRTTPSTGTSADDLFLQGLSSKK